MSCYFCTVPNSLYVIPKGIFHTTVSVTSLPSLDDAMVFFSAYTPAGQFVSMQYAFVEASPGATVKVTLPFDNADGKIGEIRAVAATLRSLVPLAASSSASSSFASSSVIAASSDRAW